MRALVTGGAGFIGSHLIDRLVAEGHQVTAIDNLSTGSTNNIAHIAEKLNLVKGDIRDADLIVVLEHGRVHSSGTHARLMAEGGLYSHLARLQFLSGGEQASGASRDNAERPL